MVERTEERLPGDDNLHAGLLAPSIAAGAARPAYSASATFWTAFFGGPLAAVIMPGLNARFLGRWQRDWPLLALALLVAVTGIVLVALPALRPGLLPFMPDWMGDRSNARLAARAVALAIWGALYWRMRPAYRASELHGDSRPAWKDGVIIVTASMLLHVGMVVLLGTAVQR
jgi:hypothetical protein